MTLFEKLVKMDSIKMQLQRWRANKPALQLNYLLDNKLQRKQPSTFLILRRRLEIDGKFDGIEWVHLDCCDCFIRFNLYLMRIC